MVLNHPQELATALNMASHWGREKYNLNLVISRHPYWQKIDMREYEHQFDSIIFLERPDYVPAPMPNPGRVLGSIRSGKKAAQRKGQPAYVAVSRMILRKLRAILLYPAQILDMILRIRRVKKQVARLGIQSDDILIWLAVGHFVDNIMLSMYPRNMKIAIIISDTYQRCTAPIDRSVYQDTLEGWVTNWLIEPVTGLHRTYCVKDRFHPELPPLVRYRQSLPEVFDKIVVLGNSNGKAGDNIITMPFPYVLTISQSRADTSGKERKKVVFFGSHFTGSLASIMDPEIYAKHVNSCLAFVRENYGADYRLVFRPHPRVSDSMGPLDLSKLEDELRLLDLEQFDIETDGMMAELYFYRNTENIHAVFSNESTSSRSAFHFLINAYSFLNIFPYDKGMKEFFRGFIGSVPTDFYISDLSVTPKKYVNTKNIDEVIKKLREVLDTLVSK